MNMMQSVYEQENITNEVKWNQESGIRKCLFVPKIHS